MNDKRGTLIRSWPSESNLFELTVVGSNVERGDDEKSASNFPTSKVHTSHRSRVDEAKDASALGDIRLRSWCLNEG